MQRVAKPEAPGDNLDGPGDPIEHPARAERERSSSSRTHQSVRRPRSYLSRQRRQVWLPAGDGGSWRGVLDRVSGPRDGETMVAYLVGPRPSRDQLLELAYQPPDGWTPGDHYLPAGGREPVVRLHRGGGLLEVHHASLWYAKVDGYTAAEAEQAAELLRDELRTVWRHDGLPLLTTPSAVGRDLWLRTIPHEVTYPTLDDDLQALIRSTSGQGRWQEPGDEHLAVHGATVPGLAAYDMRFGYAGMLRGLGVGPWTHDERPDWHPYARGRYRVEVTVPDGWAHVGLLPLAGDDGGWCYPNEPGRRFVTWADGAELLIARRHGWRFAVLERIVGAEGKPLDRFAERMLTVRSRLADAWRQGASPAACRLAAAAARTIVLHTVGALHGRGHEVTRSAPWDQPEAIPGHARDIEPPDGPAGRWTWTETKPPAWPELAHPEWSSAVWARCRARVLEHRGRGALTVPYTDVLAVHQDALYLAADPGWPDTGKVGELRREAHVSGPLPTPTSRTTLMRAAAGQAGPCCAGCGSDQLSHFPPDGSAWCAGCFAGWEQYARTDHACAGASRRAGASRPRATSA